MSVEVDDVELYESVLEYLRARESKLPTLTYRSPHLTNGDRNLIIEWMYHVGVELRISNSAQHLATALFDYFIDCHQTDKQGLYLIGLSCISIACKVEDIEVNIPQSSKLINLIPLEHKPSIGSIKSTELVILHHFDWMIHLPTEASFIDYYSASCLAMELESIDDSHYKATLTRYYNKWISYFREKTLLLDNMRSHKPSLVACAIVASSRIALVMQPEWPKGMVQLTGIQRSEFDAVLHMLLSCLEDDLTVEHENQMQKMAIPKCQTTNLISPDQGDVTNTIAYQLSSLNFQSPSYRTVGTSSMQMDPNVLESTNMRHSGSAPVSMAGDQTWAHNINPMIPHPLRRENYVGDSCMHPMVPHRECYHQPSSHYSVKHTYSANNLSSQCHQNANIYDDPPCVSRMYNQSNATAHHVGYYQESVPGPVTVNHSHSRSMFHYNQSTIHSQFPSNSGRQHPHVVNHHIALAQQHHFPQPSVPNGCQLTRRQSQNVPEYKIRKSRLYD